MPHKRENPVIIFRCRIYTMYVSEHNMQVKYSGRIFFCMTFFLTKSNGKYWNATKTWNQIMRALPKTFDYFWTRLKSEMKKISTFESSIFQNVTIFPVFQSLQERQLYRPWYGAKQQTECFCLCPKIFCLVFAKLRR